MVADNYDKMAQQSYGMSYTDFMKQYAQKTEEEIETQLTEEGTAAAKQYMVAMAIARDQDLVPDDAKYDEQAKKVAAQNGYNDVNEFFLNIDEEQFYLSIVINDVMDFVVKNAKEVK